MDKVEYLHLQQSELLVANMAATIFTGLVQKRELNSATEDALIERSVSIAIKLALQTEKLVKSDEEWSKKETSSLPIVS